jgi:hypothetical protein
MTSVAVNHRFFSLSQAEKTAFNYEKYVGRIVARMTENGQQRRESAASTNYSDDGSRKLNVESNNNNTGEMFATLAARMDALEAENKLLKEQRGFGI